MKTIFGIKEAAEFLGLSERSVKHHVYKTGLLEGQLLNAGSVLTFSLDELLAFQHNRKIIRAGRPRGRGPRRTTPRRPLSTALEVPESDYEHD